MKPSGFNMELGKSKQAKSIAPQKGICKTKAGGGVVGRWWPGMTLLAL